MNQVTCPTCGTVLDVRIDAYDSDTEFVRKKILEFLMGRPPYKGSIEKDGEHGFRFHLQTYEEVDIWISGHAEYSIYGYPSFKVEFDRK